MIKNNVISCVYPFLQAICFSTFQPILNSNWAKFVILKSGYMSPVTPVAVSEDVHLVAHEFIANRFPWLTVILHLTINEMLYNPNIKQLFHVKLLLVLIRLHKRFVNTL